jgi:hypothetical protein
VALGDSYSSGLGSGGTSSGGNCLRNANAYPEVWIASHPAYQFNFAACSGATPATVQSMQLTAITAGTTLITLTAGGNPFFVGLVSVCSVLADAACAAANLTFQALINGPFEASLSSLYAQ